jgi:hypothetical protein
MRSVSTDGPAKAGHYRDHIPAKAGHYRDYCPPKGGHYRR